MKFVGFNGRQYNVKLDNYIIRADDSTKKSQYHLKTRELLHQMFAGYSILEEVKLPGSRKPHLKSVLFLDFFIPNLMIGVEVHGKQHYEYVPYFHKTKAKYIQAIKRDSLKEEWCELNNINLIVLKYSDDIEDWREQLESL